MSEWSSQWWVTQHQAPEDITRHAQEEWRVLHRLTKHVCGEGTDILSAMTLIRQWRQAFAEFDKNDDGFIVWFELDRVLISLDICLPDNELEDMREALAMCGRIEIISFLKYVWQKHLQASVARHALQPGVGRYYVGIGLTLPIIEIDEDVDEAPVPGVDPLHEADDER